MAIHGGIHANYCPLNDRPILELNRYLFSVKLLKKLDQFHDEFRRLACVANVYTKDT